jgi:hypothetical protein
MATLRRSRKTYRQTDQIGINPNTLCHGRHVTWRSRAILRLCYQTNIFNTKLNSFTTSKWRPRARNTTLSRSTFENIKYQTTRLHHYQTIQRNDKMSDTIFTNRSLHETVRIRLSICKFTFKIHLPKTVSEISEPITVPANYLFLTTRIPHILVFTYAYSHC